MDTINVIELGEGFTADEIQQRFLELARAHATERYRPPSEPVCWGDEVLLDIAGYSQGRLIPFSIRTGVWLRLESEPMLPGLYEALVGHKPNEGLVVDITLPREYPLPSLRGCQARFLIHLQAAREVTYPSLESPEFLQAFGRGETVEEATRSIVQQMVSEAAQFLLLQGQQAVLDEVAARTRVHIPAELVDEEIRRCWRATEGRSVAELGFSQAEQQESLNTWLRDEATRSQAEQRLRLALALGAICKREGLHLTEERMEQLLRNRAAEAGVTMAELVESLRAEPEHLARIDQVAWHLLAVDYVMSRAELRVEHAQARPAGDSCHPSKDGCHQSGRDGPSARPLDSP